MKTELLHEQETYRIRGACFEVYKAMGCGFLEAVYQECLGLELTRQGIPFVAQPELTLRYKSVSLKQTYKPDFICFDRVLVELKAVSMLVDEHRAQLMNYLHASGRRVELLVNFGHFPHAEIERLVV